MTELTLALWQDRSVAGDREAGFAAIDRATRAAAAGPRLCAGLTAWSALNRCEVRAWRGADITLNFAPSAGVRDLIAGTANQLGQIVFVALVHEPVPPSMMWLIDGEHRVMGSSVGTRAELRAFLDFAERRLPPVDIEVLPFERVNDGLRRLGAGERPAGPVLRRLTPTAQRSSATVPPGVAARL